MPEFIEGSPPGGAAPLIRAAQYVRMSTDYQIYSVENQADAIAQYATEHGMQIVQTYEDRGISGLTLRKRAGLNRLLDDIQSGAADFDVLIAYDVSRWGRFQDTDEAAFYEFLCRRAGIRLIYCAESFENDGSALSTLMKSIKRVMAAEYSRELSVKVYRAQRRSAQRGFHVGAPPSFGIRRMLVDQNGTQKGVMERGDQKRLQQDHTILVPGPPSEVRTVRWMFDLFVNKGVTEREISDKLNAKGVPFMGERLWRPKSVESLLRNEKYVGTNVYGRKSQTLGSKTRSISRENWIRVEGAFQPIVSRDLFDRAQQLFAFRRRKIDRAEMLDMLRTLYDREGRLSHRLILAEPGMPAPHTYRKRFGSVYAAYREAGFTAPHDISYLDFQDQLRARIIEGFLAKGRKVQAYGRASFRIDDCWTLTAILARRQERPRGAAWWSRLDLTKPPNLTMIALISADRSTVVDYLFLTQRLRQRHFYLREDDRSYDRLKHANLADLFEVNGYGPPWAWDFSRIGKRSGRASQLPNG